MKTTTLGILLLTLHTTNLASAISCDKQLLPELSFNLAGDNLDRPCLNTKYESSGRYVPQNVIATRVQIFKDEAIVAMPRYKSGVPFTLGVTSLGSKRCNSRISPFPSWKMQEVGNCEALQSAIDIFLDANETLWVLDSGIVNTLEKPIEKCPPKVVGIDVKTGNTVKIVNFGTLVSNNSLLQHLVVDHTSDGQVSTYVSDASSRCIVVYNVTNNTGHHVFIPETMSSNNSRKDQLYLALVRKSKDTPILYSTYPEATQLFAMRVNELKKCKFNSTIIQKGNITDEIIILGTDNGSAIFFRYEDKSDVYMWNTSTTFDQKNFLLVQKGNECRFPTHVVPGYKGLMWVIESNIHHYLHNTVSSSGATVSLHPLVRTCYLV